MKYISEQLRDLVLLSQGACKGRRCRNCMWITREHFFKCPWNHGESTGEQVWCLVQNATKKIIQKIIANEN